MTELRTWKAWTDIHQPFELQWWKKALKRGHCDDPGWSQFWKEIIDFIKPSGQLIDIGCGPRPPFAPSSVIEPLAEKYQEFTPADWWHDVTVYPIPAEQLIPGLHGDTIVCWNCIDHAIGWREIIANMTLYGNVGAKFALATDFHKAFHGHPGFEREEFMSEIDARFTIEDRREPFGRDLALLMRARVA